MNFLDLAQSRRSIRDFMQKEIPQDCIINLLKAAQSSPSAGNCQPWHFFVIHDDTVREAIASTAGRHRTFILTAPVIFVVCVDTPRSEIRYGERGKMLYCIQDTAAAIQNILLCAKDLGLGACWCGNFDEDATAKVLSLPKDYRPVAIIPVGYPANEPSMPTCRRPLEEIVTFIGANGKLI